MSRGGSENHQDPVLGNGSDSGVLTGKGGHDSHRHMFRS